jgi:hypothetical protein
MTTRPSVRAPLQTVLSSPRTLAAWALLGYVALFLFFEFFQLVLPGGGGSFTSRAAGANFRALLIMAMPVLAVLLVGYVAPALPSARLISLVALIEYGVAVVLGLLTLLIGLPAMMSGVNSAHGGLGALRYLVTGAGELILISIAAYVVLRALTGRRDVQRR